MKNKKNNCRNAAIENLKILYAYGGQSFLEKCLISPDEKLKKLLIDSGCYSATTNLPHLVVMTEIFDNFE